MPHLQGQKASVGEVTSENPWWETGGDIWGRMNPRKGTSKDVMGEAGGEAARTDLAPVL